MEKSITGMAKLLNISDLSVYRALNMPHDPFKDITSFAASLKAYKRSCTGTDDYRKAALDKCLSLVTSFEEGKEVSSESYSSEDRMTALKKWTTMASCPAEVKEIYDSIRKVCGYEHDSLIFLFKRWDSLSSNAISSATTVAEARAAYWSCWHDSELTKEAERKWNALSKIVVESATTIEELEIAYKEAPNLAQKAAVRKWDKLSLEEITLAKSKEEVRIALERASHHGSAIQIAFKKWLQLTQDEIDSAKDIEQIQSVHWNIRDFLSDQGAINYNSAVPNRVELNERVWKICKRAEKKHDKYSFAIIRKAKTIPELINLHTSRLMSYQGRLAAVKKVVRLSKRVEDMEGLDGDFYRSDDLTDKIVKQKKRSFLTRSIADANEIAELQSLCKVFTIDTKARRKVIKKWLSLAQSFRDMELLFKSLAYKEIEKYGTLKDQAIQKAWTLYVR